MDTVRVKLYSAFVLILTGFVVLFFDSDVATVGVICLSLIGLLFVGEGYEMPKTYSGLPRAYLSNKFAVYTRKEVFGPIPDGVMFNDSSVVSLGWPVGLRVFNNSGSPMIVLDRHGREIG